MFPSNAEKQTIAITLKTGALSVSSLVAFAALSDTPAAMAQPLNETAAPVAANAKIPAGSVGNRNSDPLKLYREAGIDKEQEYKIRKLAKTFEEQQRVRIGLLGNLLKDMRKLELQADPDEKKALDKQNEINKIQAEIGTERIKLLLSIRNVLTFEQKERLVQNIQKSQASLFENK